MALQAFAGALQAFAGACLGMCSLHRTTFVCI